MDIYYFSGTGNSLSAAKELGEGIRDSKIIPIKKLDLERYKIEEESFIIVTPLYYYGLPLIVEDFIKRVNFPSKAYIGIVITGIYPDGIALGQTKELLRMRNEILSYGRYVKMPGNFVSSIKPLSNKKMNKVLKKAKSTLDSIANDIDLRKEFIQKESLLFRIVTNATTMYNNWKKRVKSSDNQFIIREKCDGCGICERVCPVTNINIDNNKLSFNNRCEQCYGCINYCPKKAIGYKKMTSGRYTHPDISIKELIG